MDGLSLQNDDNGMQMKGVQYQQQDCHEPMDMQHLIFNYLAEQVGLYATQTLVLKLIFDL